MPLRPAAWFFAILFFLMLIADLIFGVVSTGWGDSWTLWGPMLAIALSWIIGLIGGVFSIFILRIVKFLSILYVIGFVILAIWAISQGEWGIFGIALGGAVVTMFAGGFLIMIEQAMIRSWYAQQNGPALS